MNGPAPPLSDVEIAAHARDAGFWGQNLITMVAVALAESGGDPDNVGDEALVTTKWGPSIGLAQVRSLWADRGTGRSRDPDRLTDPAFNLRAAWEISSGGTNFRPWSMWTNQKYQHFLDRARAAVAQLAQGGRRGVVGAAGGLPDAAGGLIDSVVDPLVEGVSRIALVALLVAGGVALVAAGGWRSTSLGRAR